MTIWLNWVKFDRELWHHHVFSIATDLLSMLSDCNGCQNWRKISTYSKIRINFVYPEKMTPKWVDPQQGVPPWQCRCMCHSLQVICRSCAFLGSSIFERLKQGNPNKSPKVCVRPFHGQDHDQTRFCWTCFVLFGFRIMPKEGKYTVQIFSFFRPKSSKFLWHKVSDALGQNVLCQNGRHVKFWHRPTKPRTQRACRSSRWCQHKTEDDPLCLNKPQPPTKYA